MASGARDEFTDVVENVTSRQAKLAEAQGAQTENQQRAEQSKQNSLIDVSHEGSAKPARRKGNTKATKRTQQAPQLLALPTSRRLRYQVRPTKLSLRFPKRPTTLLRQPLVRLGRTSLLIPSLSLRVAGFCARLHCPARGSSVLINSRSI